MTYMRISQNKQKKRRICMINRLKNFFFYAGTDCVRFERVKTKIQKANLTMTLVTSTFAIILIAAMYISSFNSEGVKQNRVVYLIGLVLSIAILLLALTLGKKHIGITPFLISLSYTIYYMYGIIIGAITDPDGKTVTFMVLLVFMPILFIARPVYITLATSIFVTIFVILCTRCKAGAVLSVDVIDAVVFGILGVSSGSVINQMKVRGYVLEQKLQEISRFDQLTKTRNRNAFEVEQDSILSFCKHSLACVYMDVNGLHEVNNEKGHEYGDKMLKYIASEIKKAFSEELTYRVGGDEFIAFVPDKEEREIEQAIANMNSELEKESYHVAVGYENSKSRHLRIDTLIKAAEVKMFCDKNRYYKNIANREVRNNK